MSSSLRLCFAIIVSLFTREWIEISFLLDTEPEKESPSLRGSGLKFTYLFKIFALPGLPLYEGVD